MGHYDGECEYCGDYGRFVSSLSCSCPGAKEARAKAEKRNKREKLEILPILDKFGINHKDRDNLYISDLAKDLIELSKKIYFECDDCGSITRASEIVRKDNKNVCNCCSKFIEKEKILKHNQEIAQKLDGCEICNYTGIIENQNKTIHCNCIKGVALNPKTTFRILLSNGSDVTVKETNRRQS